jgi:hypothetical protein
MWFWFIESLYFSVKECCIYLFKILSSTWATFQLFYVWDRNWYVVMWMHFDLAPNSLANFPRWLNHLTADLDHKDIRHPRFRLSSKIRIQILAQFESPIDPLNQMGESSGQVQTGTRTNWSCLQDPGVWSGVKIETFWSACSSVFPWSDFSGEWKVYW